MHSASFNRLLRLVLLPVWAMLVGFTPGRWYCADGRPCAVATVAACCCVAEAEASPDSVHQEATPEAAITAGECGCYRQALVLDVATPGAAWLQASAAPPMPAITWLRPDPGTVIARAVPAAAHSPPQHLMARADPRGPPTARRSA